MNNFKGKIFINYRRDDSSGTTGRICDKLLKSFSTEQIFIDVDTIFPGKDFVKEIEEAVSKCDVFIAIIGRNWLQLSDQLGQRLLNRPGDYVRNEIKIALERKIFVIPVLVENALMPTMGDLPEGSPF